MIRTIVSTELPVDERLQIKCNRLSNGTGGKRICIVTGTHGDELEGQYVCFKLSHDIKKNIDKLNGTIDIYPALNPLGIDTISRGIPNFDLDMNRIFPGNPNGSMAEYTAYKVLEDLKGADMVIDIHSSNIFLREVPQVRININDSQTLVPYAKMLNIDFIWVHDAATVLEATLAHSLNSTGTPTLVVEMGVGMRINHGYGDKLLKGIYNLMYEMGIWSEKIDDENLSEPILSVGDEVAFINAQSSGVFITEIKNNEYISEDDEIGQIVDPFSGEIIEKIKAPAKGFLFTLRAYPIVYEGSLIARLHRMK